jgi:hypothetical protein
MKAGGNSISASKRKLMPGVVALLAVVGGLVGVFFLFDNSLLGTNDPMFYGEPESEWIKNLKNGDNQQLAEWRTFGEEGVQVLIRGFERADRSQPAQRLYRHLFVKCLKWARFIARWLPMPKADATFDDRRLVAEMLGGLGIDAKSAIPIMSNTIRHDEHPHVRALAICFFISSQAENFQKSWLHKLSPGEKLALLPLFIRALQDDSSEVRFHAAAALTFYPEQKLTVAPVLLRALNDPATYARLRIADSLNQIDPGSAKKANLVAIVAPLVKDPDWSVALGAAKFLGHCPYDPEAAIAALRPGLQSTNDFVVFESVWSSLQYDAQRAGVISTLEEISTTNPAVERNLRNSKLRLQFLSVESSSTLRKP